MQKIQSVNFFKEEIRFRLNDSSRLPQWITQVILRHKKKPGEINYIFCSDRYLQKLNKKYLNHKTYTDIITFNTSEEKSRVSGDIFISAERVRINAVVYKTSFSNELHRVMIHGILHLVGFNDSSKSEKVRMRALEDQCLALKKF